MPLNITTLKCFLSVVETGNITQTALRVNRTQSAVSQQISRLEALLGKQLFNRENGLTLTRDGEIFLSYARKIYQLQHESIHQLNEISFEGEIKIGLPEDYASKVLSKVLVHFAELHPLINLNVECELTSNLWNRFQRNEFDVCIIKAVNGEQIPNNAIVFEDDLMWVGSAERIKQLKKNQVIPVILSPQGSVYRTLALETLDNAGIKYRVAFSSRSYVSKIAAATAGIGITIMQKSFLSRKQHLHVVPNMPPLGMVNLCILHHTNNATIEYLVKLLLQLMQGAF